MVRILNLKDSSEQRARIVLDDRGIKGYIDFGIAQGGKYEIRVDRNMLTDIYGNKNDSIKIATEATTADNYCNLMLTLMPSKEMAAGGSYLVQLVDEKLEMKYQQSASGGKIKFEHLKPGKYQVRVILDANGNGAWDAGDYWSRRQPEKVVYLDKVLDLRANWDMEEKIEL